MSIQQIPFHLHLIQNFQGLTVLVPQLLIILVGVRAFVKLDMVSFLCISQYIIGKLFSLILTF